jgi:hypothetical protein
MIIQTLGEAPKPAFGLSPRLPCSRAGGVMKTTKTMRHAFLVVVLGLGACLAPSMPLAPEQPAAPEHERPTPSLFDVNASYAASPGTCVDGRWLRDTSDEGRPVLVDCAAFGTWCEPDFPGCIGQPGEPCDPRGVCRLGDHVEGCVDLTCADAPRDSNGFDVPITVTLPSTVLVSINHPGDRDCFIIDSDEEVLVSVTFNGSFGSNRGFLRVVSPGSDDKFCFSSTTIATFKRIELDALENVTLWDNASARLCFGDTSIEVTDDALSATTCERGCSSVWGTCITNVGPCESHEDCPGACEAGLDGEHACVALVDRPPTNNTCVDGRFFGHDIISTCGGACFDGLGCVNAPGESCTVGFCEDPFDGLVTCTDGVCPDLSNDDAPGRYTAGRSATATDPVELRYDGPGDIDCLRIVDVSTPTWSPTAVGGRVQLDRHVVFEGDDLVWESTVCVTPEEGGATITFVACSPELPC